MRGTRVQVINPKHKQHGKCGVLKDMDRGNVYVILDGGKEICTRMDALGPAPEPTPLQTFIEEVEMPWCAPCKSYHVEVRDAAHGQALLCFAYVKPRKRNAGK